MTYNDNLSCDSSILYYTKQKFVPDPNVSTAFPCPHIHFVTAYSQLLALWQLDISIYWDIKILIVLSLENNSWPKQKHLTLMSIVPLIMFGVQSRLFVFVPKWFEKMLWREINRKCQCSPNVFPLFIWSPWLQCAPWYISYFFIFEFLFYIFILFFILRRKAV